MTENAEEEFRAEREMRRLAELLREKEVELENVRTDLRVANSTIKVQEAEIRLLSDVLARDRTRVQAETAVAAQQIAAATAPTKRGQGDG
jgi:hypothetical protein